MPASSHASVRISPSCEVMHVNDKSEPHLLRELEAMLGFAFTSASGSPAARRFVFRLVAAVGGVM